MWVWLVLSGCSTDDWCERFNFDCDTVSGVEREFTDQDGDVWALPDDCNDLRSDIYPGAEEVCDGLDNDCDGDVDEGLGEPGYRDVDGDGYGDPDVTRTMCDGVLDGWSLTSGDCDDTYAYSYPGARERCDKEDNDCDGEIDEDTVVTVYGDSDRDGHGDPKAPQEVCYEDIPEGTVFNSSDCDDSTASRAPDAPEACFDSIDNDCDKAVDEADCELLTVELFVGSDGGLDHADARGDYNGDGTPDLVAGSPRAAHLSNTGSAFVLYAPLDNGTELELAAAADTRIYNGGGSSQLGSVVAAVRDVDSDGYDEVAISSPQTAEVFVFRAPFPSTLSSTNYDMRISEGGGSARLGMLFLGDDDLTGDGRTDLLIGRGENTADAAASLFSIEDLNAGVEYGIELTWAESWGSDPPPLATGDLTGDGAADLLATFDEQIYVLSGPITANTDISTAGTSAVSDTRDNLGAALRIADMDGDGYDDLIAGAPESNQGAERAGAVYLFLGPLSGSLGESDAIAMVTGEANYDRAGGTVATSDRDQDGLPDLIVGASAQYADFSPTMSGTYTVLGPLSGTLSLADAAARFQDADGASAHPMLAGGADLNDDGVEDVLVGAPRARASDGSQGLLYVLPRTF